MTIQVELDPETEARLTAQTAQRGMAPGQYAGEFLRDNLPLFSTVTGILRDCDLDEMTRELTRGSENLTILPPEATGRASFYEDRW